MERQNLWSKNGKTLWIHPAHFSGLWYASQNRKRFLFIKISSIVLKLDLERDPAKIFYMELIEADIEAPELEVAKSSPPPERRRVAVSLAFTLMMLATTIGYVYKTFRKVETLVVQDAALFHQSDESLFGKMSNDQFYGLCEAADTKIIFSDGVSIKRADIKRSHHRVHAMAVLKKGQQQVSMLITSTDARDEDQTDVWNGLHVRYHNRNGTLVVILSEQPIPSVKEWVVIQ